MAGKHHTDEFKKGVVHLYINEKPIEESKVNMAYQNRHYMDG
jgi:hypothetical protein